MTILGTPLGWIMHLIYGLVHNYGIAIILFTILAKLLMLPVAVKQQKNQARIQTLQPKLAALKKSFANNPQRLQEEQNKLYAEEGINPFASCLPSFLSLFILYGVIDVIYRPITHILRLKDQATAAKVLLEEWLAGQGLTEKYLSSRPELIIQQYVRSNPEIFQSIEGFVDKVNSLDMQAFGLFDLSKIPTLHPETWNLEAVCLVLIPFLSGAFQLILTLYTMQMQKKSNPDMPGMGGTTLMFYIMPIFSIWFAFKMPAGIGFYWAISSLLSMLQTIGLRLYFTPERAEVIAAKEKEKAKAKGPGFMQKMLEQQQALQEQQGTGRTVVSPTGNRVTYSDETEGMSRSELSAYHRQRIAEARRQMAEDYGEDYEESSEQSDD